MLRPKARRKARAHIEVARDHARQAYAQTLEGTTDIQVFGTPTDNILRMIQQQAGIGSGGVQDPV